MKDRRVRALLRNTARGAVEGLFWIIWLFAVFALLTLFATAYCSCTPPAPTVPALTTPGEWYDPETEEEGEGEDGDEIYTGWWCFDYRLEDGVYVNSPTCHRERHDSLEVSSCYRTKVDCERVRRGERKVSYSAHAKTLLVDCRLDVRVQDVVLLFLGKPAERASAVDPRLRQMPETAFVVDKPAANQALVVTEGVVRSPSRYNLVAGQYYYLQTAPGVIGSQQPQGQAVVADWVVGYSYDWQELIVGHYRIVFHE